MQCGAESRGCRQCCLRSRPNSLHKPLFANLPDFGLLRCLRSHALGPCHCRFLSDAVTGVAIVTILFFFPSQKPSLKWWFDFKGKVVKAGVTVGSVRTVASSMIISGLGRVIHLGLDCPNVLTMWPFCFPFPCLSSSWSGRLRLTVQGKG